MNTEKLEYFRQYREKHRERLKEYQRKYWKQFYNEIRRKRYRIDTEYRQSELERKRLEYRASKLKGKENDF